jgi:O-antigen ligase
LGNPNGLGEWFGFCAIYFIIVGIETKRNIVRIASWLTGLGCLFIVGLTVSRGALLAVVAATVFALRRSLKRGFLPLLGLTILAWFAFESGLFAQAVTFYENRGTEETGRFLVWPLAIERFLNSPLIGVGIAHVETFVPPDSHFSPHNSFLYIALASGVVPLAFFTAYWVLAARGARRSSADQSVDAPFRIPLVVFAFLTSCASNAAFMAPWATVGLLTAIPPEATRRGPRGHSTVNRGHGHHRSVRRFNAREGRPRHLGGVPRVSGP